MTTNTRISVKPFQDAFPNMGFTIFKEAGVIHIYFDAYFPDDQVDELHWLAVKLFGASTFILERMVF